VDPLPLQAAEEALRHGVVPAVALAAHATLDASGLQQLLGVLAGALTAPVRGCSSPCGGCRPLSAMSSALRTPCQSMRSLIDQPTTRREEKCFTDGSTLRPHHREPRG
jgi:hypothetical protein